MKIKKYLKRLLVVLPCISVLLLSFAFPVSAVSGSDWFSLNPSWQTLYGSGTYAQLSANGNYLGEYPPYEWYGSSGVSYNLSNGVPAGSWELRMRAMNVNIQLDAGEVFQFSSLYEGTVYKDLGSQPTITIRFVERIDENGTINNVVLSTIEFTPKWNGTVERYTHTINHKWQATRDCNINMIVVDVTVNDRPSTGSGTGGRTRFYLKQIQMGWGNADAATAPNYSNPDKGDLESLEDKEQELESNTAEGQQEVQDIISPDTLTSTLLSYAKGLQFTSRIMLSAITKIPFLNALIWVSMSLGFVATLFALSASIIAASDRRAGSTARAGKHSRR